jgi:hypothetical protein
LNVRYTNMATERSSRSYINLFIFTIYNMG